MAKFPQTSRQDILPEGKPYQAPKKYGQISFNEAMNKPNDPQKRYQRDFFECEENESHNVTNDYCDDDAFEDLKSDNNDRD